MNLEPRVLEVRFVRLEPITPDLREEMRGAIDCDPDAWEIMSVNGCGEGFPEWWAATLAGHERGDAVTFAVRRIADRKVVGASSYLNIRRAHKGLEIGATFLHPDVRSGPVNPESKRLMLAHAFDAGAIRVEFMIDARNARSQAAVLTPTIPIPTIAMCMSLRSRPRHRIRDDSARAHGISQTNCSDSSMMEIDPSPGYRRAVPQVRSSPA